MLLTAILQTLTLILTLTTTIRAQPNPDTSPETVDPGLGDSLNDFPSDRACFGIQHETWRMRFSVTADGETRVSELTGCGSSANRCTAFNYDIDAPDTVLNFTDPASGNVSLHDIRAVGAWNDHIQAILYPDSNCLEAAEAQVVKAGKAVELRGRRGKGLRFRSFTVGRAPLATDEEEG